MIFIKHVALTKYYFETSLYLSLYMWVHFQGGFSSLNSMHVFSFFIVLNIYSEASSMFLLFCHLKKQV